MDQFFGRLFWGCYPPSLPLATSGVAIFPIIATTRRHSWTLKTTQLAPSC